MSLFKVRSLWSTTVGNEEEFDQGCMCVGIVDNRPTTGDKVVVGSYHGYLRIYQPHLEKTENGFTGIRPEDVLCENNLQFPILQVEIGRFSSATDGNVLAVLHPRKLSVYNFIGMTGAVEHGMQYQLKLLYEHNLARTACNFCFGSFGGVKGKDFMCVQSMDGTLSIFEQESFAFSRFLPGALLPGPLAYLPRTDSFVTVSSSREVECYKFQVLAVATDVKNQQESMNIKSGKRVVPDWTLNIGEEAIDLQVASYLNNTHAICVLGERSYFTVSETGKLQFVKKLDFNPSCFYPYRSVSDNELQCLLATHTNTLLILHNTTLRWAAQLNYCPVQVRTANFQGDLRGIVITLSSDGRLDFSYLGTDPAMFTAPTAELREIDYAQLDSEMKQLQQIIREQQSKSLPALPSTKTEEGLQLIVSVPPNLDEPSLASDVEIKNEEHIPSITVKISLKTKSILNDVKLSIHAAPPLGVNEDLISFSSIEPSHTGDTQVTFYMKYAVLPADLRAEITATYQSVTGAPRVTTSVVRLPLTLVCKPVLPVKQADYKITVDTNKPPVNLNDIFPDLLGENAGSPGNALGFAFYGLNPVVTVLASQKSQRYRLQSDDFASMWPLLNELVQRLRGHFSSRSVSDFRVSYDGALPLQEYFDVLDSHFECRQNADKLNKLLEERAAQFIAIERRLLTRFKDKTPAPLANLDTLLDGTYRQIMALADASNDNRRSLTCCGAALSCATRSLNLMVRLWLDLPDAEFAVLETTLLPTVVDNGTQGWEEMVDAAITHLLRTTLAKSAKDLTVNPSPLTLLRDTTKLKKHIALLIDKLSKGAKLVIEGVTPALATVRPSPKPSHKPEVKSTPTDSAPSTLHTTLDTVPEATPPAFPQPIREPETTSEAPPTIGLSLGGRSGSDFLKKTSVVESVPDLDDMADDVADESDVDRLLSGQTNELVYGL